MTVPYFGLIAAKGICRPLIVSSLCSVKSSGRARLTVFRTRSSSVDIYLSPWQISEQALRAAQLRGAETQKYQWVKKKLKLFVSSSVFSLYLSVFPRSYRLFIIPKSKFFFLRVPLKSLPVSRETFFAVFFLHQGMSISYHFFIYIDSLFLINPTVRKYLSRPYVVISRKEPPGSIFCMAAVASSPYCCFFRSVYFKKPYFYNNVVIFN